MQDGDPRGARDLVDTGALPETEPHPAPIFDTGPHPAPLPGPAGTSAAPVLVPGQLSFLKRWQLALLLLAVWVPAAAAGLGLFSWWYSLTDKTPAGYVVLVYVMVCVVTGVLLAMVGDRPLISALGLAVVSAVFASMVAAAPLYGHYYCQVKSPCLAGIIPY